MDMVTMIWGVGNSLYCDDSAGIKVSERLKESPPENTVIFTCYTVPGNYVCKIEKYRPERLIIIDASDMGLDPGQFRRFNLSRIADISFTNHDMPLEKMLRPYSDIEITVIGIEPKIKDLGESLSEEVSEAIDKIIWILQRDGLEEIEELERSTR